MHLDRDEWVITLDPDKISVEDLIGIIEASGYSATQVAESAVPAPEDASGGSPPRSDDPLFVTAMSQAARQRRPLVIDFHATWCAPCREMLAKTLADPSVVPLLDQTVFLKVDTWFRRVSKYNGQ